MEGLWVSYTIPWKRKIMELCNLLKENFSPNLTTYVQIYVHAFHAMYEWSWSDY